VYYGEEKVRQMARSILPSTWRVSARKSLRAIKQRHRAMVRQELRLLDEDNEPRDSFNPRGYPSGEIAFVVRERRGADKLGHFEKWAVEVTAGIAEVDGRRATMRAMLPKGLIGDHAMSHLENYEAFEPDAYRYGRRPGLKATTPEEQRAAAKASREAAHARRVRVLEDVVRTGWGHRLLNANIKHSTVQHPVWTVGHPVRVPAGSYGRHMTVLRDEFVDTDVGPTRPRKLGGLGDVEAFLRDLYAATRDATVEVDPYIVRDVRPVRYHYWNSTMERRTYVYEYVRTTRTNPSYHPEWLRSVDEFVSTWEAARGDRATLRKAYRAG
jgi:hypothetical protein